VSIQIQILSALLPGSYVNAVDLLSGTEVGIPISVASFSFVNNQPFLIFYDSPVTIENSGGSRTIIMQYRTPNANTISIMTASGVTNDRGSWIIQQAKF
jgi:hypothetical protein